MPEPSHNPAIRTENVGTFLLRRLREAGLTHLFGVAGDFNLELLEQLEAVPDLTWVGCCNELNAAYAADGYARTRGLSALLTTYGVGELSALCGVAGAYAEHVPVIAISGAPPLSEIERKGLMHHTAGDGDFDNMMVCGREFSVAQARIMPQNAVAEIDRCLRACVMQKQPVYLQLPSDLAYTEIQTPVAPFAVEFGSDAGVLEDFTRAALDRIAGAQSCAILVDADVGRFGQGAAVQRLAERLGCPIAVMSTAKGMIDETHPLYIGVYSGRLSAPAVRQTIEQAACLITLAVRFVDSTTSSFSQKINPECSIDLGSWHGRVDQDYFQGIFIGDALARLASAPQLPQRIERAPAVATEPPRELTQAWFWHRVAAFLQKDDVVVAENGTSLAGITGTSLPSGVSVITQALWGAIGYSLPATFGSMIAAPSRRHLLFIGDGSFQVTGQELSSILRHRLKPVIFLINNDGYTIERLILGATSSYNDIQPWKYASLCEVFAGDTSFDSRRVSTVEELEAALSDGGPVESCRFIEVMMPRMDAPDSLKTLGGIYARQDYGRAWAQRTNAARRMT